MLTILFWFGAHAQAWDDPAWSSYQGNALHSGDIGREVIAGDYAIVWRVNIGSRAVSGFAIGAETVFATSVASRNADTILIALALDNGQELWRKTFLTAFSVNPPAYDAESGTVLIQTENYSDDSFLRAYAAVGGTVRWQSPYLTQGQRYLAPTVINGMVFVGGGTYGGAYAFDLSTGAQNWFTSLPFFDELTPTALGNDEVIVYTNRMSVLSRVTGAVSYEIIDPDFMSNDPSVNQTPVVISTRAYVTNQQFLVAYDLAARAIAWKIPISAYGQVSSNGSVVFVVASSSLSAHSPVDGTVLWSVTPTLEGLGPQILVFRSHVIVGNSSKTYLINTRTRVIEKTWLMGGELAYGDGRLLIGSSNGAVTAIRLDSTALLTDGFE